MTIPAAKVNYAEQLLADTRVLRIILRQIAEETDFLLEAKLMNLLKPYISANNENIIEIDNVFKVCARLYLNLFGLRSCLKLNL